VKRPRTLGTSLASHLEEIAPPELDYPIDPTVGWHRSSRDDITYDIVIYKALPYEQRGNNRIFVHGPIVEYATHLEEATYTLKRSLEPGSKYFWSVRLRGNDVVSNWSTTSYHSLYFLLLVYGSESGAGVPFNFSTP